MQQAHIGNWLGAVSCVDTLCPMSDHLLQWSWPTLSFDLQMYAVDQFLVQIQQWQMQV